MVEDADYPAAGDGETPEADFKRVCGIIMPISATSNQTEAHWTAVRTLISRAIEKAGFTPTPVWENSATDRVSERIIGNIFQFPIVVADISDSNPNVMLELGLRLASKRPTIIVINNGGTIPFDIRDFHALHYPPSLSILEMEAFIEELARALMEKDKASQAEGYTPFLGRVIVDVVAPGEREVPLGQFLLERLDEISAKLSAPSPQSNIAKTIVIGSAGQVSSISNAAGTAFFFTLPKMDPLDFGPPRTLFPKDLKLINVGGSTTNEIFALSTTETMSKPAMERMISTLATVVSGLGGTMGVPDAVAARAPVF